MTKEKNYLLWAVAISAFGHLLWLSIVDIRFSGGVRSPGRFGEVVFLGSVLERADFRTALGAAAVRKEISFKPSFLAKKERELDVRPPARITAREMSGKAAGGKTRDDAAGAARFEKLPPDIFGSGKGLFYTSHGVPVQGNIEGPLKTRPIVFKPDAGELTKNMGPISQNMSVRMKVTVSGSGTVSLVEPVLSSGSPRIDMECEQYLRAWRFSQDGDTGADWGIVTLDIKQPGHDKT